MKNINYNWKLYSIILSLFISTHLAAQTTSIPDTQFEQILINEGIDSDGTINGQVLTSDIVAVPNLNLRFVQDLTGLQDFFALESLKLEEGGMGLGAGLMVDLTANANLKKVEIHSFEGLSTLDLTGLTSLEELILRESQGDVMTMEIDSLDLSTNTNIEKVDLGAMFFLQTINLQNGNNTNMLNFELHLAQDDQGGPPFPDRPMCIKVDDAAIATANNAPYSSWIVDGIAPTFYESGMCTLSVRDVEMATMAVYPNPVESEFQLNSPVAINEIEVFSMQGKQVARFSSQENYDVSYLSPGMYFLKISIPNSTQVMRFVKK